MPSGRFFVPMEPEHRASMAPNFIPGAVLRRPIQILPKNLNGGKADGSYHQL